MEIQFKKLSSQCITPTKAHETDAGFDIYASSEPIKEMDQRGFIVTYKTDLAVNIPSGFMGLMFPRSSISRTALSLTNAVGVIDSGYQGEILFKFRDAANGYVKKMQYQKGERIGQLVIIPIPEITLTEVTDFDTTTERGEQGFGSSGV